MNRGGDVRVCWQDLWNVLLTPNSLTHWFHFQNKRIYPHPYGWIPNEYETKYQLSWLIPSSVPLAIRPLELIWYYCKEIFRNSKNTLKPDLKRNKILPINPNANSLRSFLFLSKHFREKIIPKNNTPPDVDHTFNCSPETRLIAGSVSKDAVNYNCRRSKPHKFCFSKMHSL